MPIKRLIIPSLFAVLSSFSIALHSRSYLVVNLGPPSEAPAPTYLAAEAPYSDWRSIGAPQLEHFALDAGLTLLRLRSGRYRLSHYDFTDTTRGDERTAYFLNDGWTIQIHSKAVHYMGPETFEQSDPTHADTVMVLELLCGSFPLEISELREFHFLRYDRSSSLPIKYSCKPDADVYDRESPH